MTKFQHYQIVSRAVFLLIIVLLLMPLPTSSGQSNSPQEELADEQEQARHDDDQDSETEERHDLEEKDETADDDDDEADNEGERRRGRKRPKAASQLKWLGPDNVAGRIRSVLIHPNDANIIYAGAATGGVWKSTNGGQSWSSLDDFMPSLVIGSLAMDPQDPNTIYAGTGEIFTRLAEGVWLRGEDRGQGIFVSRNAGATWNALAFTQTQTDDWRFVSRIAIDPSSSTHIFAATNTGLWSSTNGGQSFDRVLSGIFLDVKIHPRDPRNVVASSLGGFTMFSTNFGGNWTASIPPTGPNLTGTRVELAALPTVGQWRALLLGPGGPPNQVLLSSVDSGATFTFTAAGGEPVCNNNRIYTGGLWVDPRNTSKMLVGGVGLCKVTIDVNGVQTVSRLPQTDAVGLRASDFHAIVEHPGFASGADDGILVGFDQGLHRLRSYDATTPTVESLNNGLRTTQFHSAATNPVSGDVIGTTQDTSVLLREGETWRQPNGEIEDGAMATTESGGRNYYYGQSIGRIFRSVNGGTPSMTSECISAQSASKLVESLADSECGGAAGLATFCGNKTPLLLDPIDQNRLFVGCGQLWRTTNARASPSNISWKSVKPRSGNFVINVMDIAKGNANLMWLGAMDTVGGVPGPGSSGQLWKSINATDGLPTFTRMDIGKNLPARPVFDVAIDPRKDQEVYVSYSGFASDNVWKTANGGTDWENIAAGLPDVPVWSLAVHPTRAGWLYAGTDVGLYTSTDDGDTWSATTRGPSTVAISDLQWKGDTTFLTVATYGRGVHELDARANPERLFPETSTRGLVIGAGGGHVENLLASDNKRFVAGSSFLSTVSVVLTTRGGFTAAETPAGSLEFFIEALANLNASQKLEVFNFSTNSYVVLNTTSVTGGAEKFTLRQVAKGASRFINPTTRELQARITWTKSTSATVLFQVEIDAAGWTITRP